jgi:hypothetical protein
VAEASDAELERRAIAGWWYASLVRSATTGFADRYNLTSSWYWVEVYYERGAPYNDIIRPATYKFYPNATGFVKISWPDTWANVTVVVKAKSYDGH